jgi:hypothetical protein
MFFQSNHFSVGYSMNNFLNTKRYSFHSYYRMSHFLRYPADWAIGPRSEFQRYECSIDSQLSGELLIQAGADASIPGNFRFVLTGSGPVRAAFKAESIMAVGGSTAYKLTYEINPDEIRIKTNTFASDWLDISQG